MTLETTKEQIDLIRGVIDSKGIPHAHIKLHSKEVLNLCHDADRARELEEEISDLRAKLDDAYKAVVSVVEDGYLYFGPEGMTENQENLYAVYLIAICALKEQENG